MTRWANYNLVNLERGEFLPSHLEVIERPSAPAWPIAKTALGLLFLSAAAWSYFGCLEDYTTAAGKLQSVGRTKVIEPTVVGQVLKIGAKNGDRVEAGQTLVELDPRGALAGRTIIADKLLEARAQIAALKAGVAASQAAPIDVAPKIAMDADIPEATRARAEELVRADLTQLAAKIANLAEQRSQAMTSRDKFIASVAAQKEYVAVVDERAQIDQLLAGKGWNSRLKVLESQENLRQQQIALAKQQTSLAEADAAIPVIESEIAKAHASYVTTSVATLTTLGIQAADLKQQLAKADQTLADMTLRSPVSGVVLGAKVTSVGQVVKPGQQLMQVTPIDGSLEAIAYVANTDAGFVKVGQQVDVEVQTFPLGNFGTVPGTVVYVATNNLPTLASDVLQSESLDGDAAQTSAAQQTGNLMFPITVQLQNYSMNIYGRSVPLRSGMAISVAFKTEDRRAIDYIWSPVMALLTTAAHEWQ